MSARVSTVPVMVFVMAECQNCPKHWAVIRSVPRARPERSLLYFDRAGVFDWQHPNYMVASDQLICPGCGQTLQTARLGVMSEENQWIEVKGNPIVGPLN